MMVPIMDRKAPTDVAKQWLKDHPEDMKRWLDGVTTFDGKDAATAVQVAVNK
jgi:glycine betaine/proline transport system substrate-binding protein